MKKLSIGLAVTIATLGLASPAAASGGTNPPPVPYVKRDVPTVALDPGLVKAPTPKLDPYVKRDLPTVALDPGLVVKCLNPPPGVSKEEFRRILKEMGGVPQPPPPICP